MSSLSLRVDTNVIRKAQAALILGDKPGDEILHSAAMLGSSPTRGSNQISERSGRATTAKQKLKFQIPALLVADLTKSWCLTKQDLASNRSSDCANLLSILLNLWVVVCLKRSLQDPLEIVEDTIFRAPIILDYIQ